MTKRSEVFSFILALSLSLILLISISLFFLMGFKPIKKNQLIQVNSLLKPCQCGCQEIKPIGKLINGEIARAYSWPWEMILMIIDMNRNPISFCGATLITDRHILTAAHCVHQYIPPFIYLFPNQEIFHLNISLSLGYRVNKMYIHEGFNVLLHHDIAILTVENSFRFDSFLSPICLATPISSILKMMEELIVIGRGRVSAEPGSIMYPDHLQQIKVNYIPTSHPNCSEIFQPITNIHPGQMCAGKEGYNACHGDSGGPLMRKISIPNTENYYWEQIGIASKTIDCGWNSTWPDIYINIPYYYQWIIQTIKRAT